jgi:valyl-tRNA synthetase
MPVARGLGFAELATIVAADALVRRAWSVGRAAELIVPTLQGDLSTQYAFEKDLAREGHDRNSLTPDELEARAAAFDDSRRLAAARTLARLSVTADLGLATTATPEAARAARTAFVKLYEEGLVEEADRVVATCPRCRTAVDAVDIERGELVGERLTIRLVTSTGEELDLEVHEPELLPGVVAVAVPEGAVTSPTASVIVPIADREVPVLVAPLHGSAAPGIVVAAHDEEAHELAQANGLAGVTVLDADGAVVCEGPLQGLGRYAARQAAKALLDAEGVLVHAEPATEEVLRCRCCGSVLVPQLGRQWFLRSTELEVAAADAVRHGLVAFSPSDARDAFLAGAGIRREWCLSTRVAGGVPIPAALCLDCGKLTVDVETSGSCGKCMGPLVAEPLFLDGRFVAALWPVVLAGWPGRGGTNYPPAETAVVVSGADLLGWALPALALGLRLAGSAPFGGVVAHPWPPHAPPGDDRTFAEESEADPRVLRLALVAGTGDVDVAAAAVDALDRPFDGESGAVAEVAGEAAAGVAALDECSPAQAAALLTSALSAGVPADVADRVRALALPILGD